MVRPIERVVILGHTGFIGTHLVSTFRRRSPEVEIVGVSPPTIDLTQEGAARSLASLLDERTAVIMCAAIKKQLGDSLEIFDANLKMVINVCRVVLERRVRRVVYFSSAEVYGTHVHNTAITEDTPVRPASYYGIAKYAGEGLLARTLETWGNAASLLVLRPPLVYGPGDAASRSYGPSGFVWAAVHGQKITVWGDGGELRDFVYVEDLAEAVRRLTFHDYAGVVNVATGRSRTFREVLDGLAQLVGGELVVDFRPRTRPMVDQAFDTTRLRRLLPDVSFTTLEEGLRRTIESESTVGSRGRA